MRLNRPDIARLIPHAGRMVLLDGIIDWTAESLRARACSHRAPDNPLRRAGRLSILAGIEYAAQATAIHGALLRADSPGCAEGGGARQGFLAMARDIRWSVDRLDTLVDDLDIQVQLLTAQTDSTLYAFRLIASDAERLGGRLAIFFPEGAKTP